MAEFFLNKYFICFSFLKAQSWSNETSVKLLYLLEMRLQPCKILEVFSFTSVNKEVIDIYIQFEFEH